jgi:hypothetical protein
MQRERECVCVVITNKLHHLLLRCVSAVESSHLQGVHFTKDEGKVAVESCRRRW